MNKRALLQYRLQSTVEGLSIAAVSYYVVGLIAYMVKGIINDSAVTAAKFTAVSVPIAVVLIWFLIRRVRKIHI